MSQVVIPAKAGTQSFNSFLKGKFKAWIPAFAGMTIAFSGIARAEVAFVYENEAAVREGRPVIGSVVTDGIMTTAKLALSAGNNLLAGQPGKDLHKAVLVRLDNDLDIAVIRLGEVVQSQELISAFNKKSQALLNFAPQSTSTVVANQPIPLPPLVAPVGEGWALKINGQAVGSDPILLKTFLKKSKFEAELVCLSTSPVWQVSMKLTSNPKAAFWKQGRPVGMNDIPRKVFIYDHQVLFQPLKDGKSIVVPIEAHYVEKNQEYDWTFEISSKKTKMLTQTVRVKFQ